MAEREGIWLDRIPQAPRLVACVDCGDPLQWMEVMVTHIAGRTVTPLCRPCFDKYPEMSGA